MAELRSPPTSPGSSPRDHGNRDAGADNGGRDLWSAARSLREETGRFMADLHPREVSQANGRRQETYAQPNREGLRRLLSTLP